MSWFAPLVAQWRLAGVPRPSADAVVSAGHPVQIRVLIIGGGPAVGWGVLTHDVALAGHLARLLARALGRGVEVRVHADSAMTAKKLSAGLADVQDLEAYDALIWTVGVNDTLAGTTPAAWSERLTAAVKQAERRGIERSAILLVPIQPIASIPLVGGWIAIRAELHRRALNEESDVLFQPPGQTRTEPLSIPEPKPERFRDSNVYARWAHDLLPTLTDMLNARSTPATSTAPSSPPRATPYRG